MNRTLIYGAKLFAHLDPSKGVGSFRQQDGGQFIEGHSKYSSLDSMKRIQRCIASINAPLDLKTQRARREIIELRERSIDLFY